MQLHVSVVRFSTKSSVDNEVFMQVQLVLYLIFIL